MSKKRVGLLIVCILLAVATLMGCSPKNEYPTTQGNPLPSGTITPSRPEGDGYVIVETPYGELYYQDQWVDSMQVEQTQEQDVLKVVFGTQINGNVLTLFTLEIGGGSGRKIGQLTDSRGTKRDVNATVHSLPENLALTEEEANRVYAMQEEINYIIQYLH